MSCSPYDLRDAALGELSPEALRDVQAHLKSCTACHEEMERFRLTEAALLTLRDEEIPQRIAFVSDRVWEPSPVRRWWTAFWNSGPRLGFASAAMLSAALMFFTLNRPIATEIAHVQTVATAPADLDARIQSAVEKAVAASDQRNQERTAELLKAAETRHKQDREFLQAAFSSQMELMQKRYNVLYRASADYGVSR